MPVLNAALRALLPMLVLATSTGCAAPGEGGLPRWGAGQPSPSTAAVRAFAQICGSLQGEAVARQAQAFAFVPMEAVRQEGAMPALLRAEGLRAWVRPVAGAPALLIWNEQGRSCELGAGGVDPPEVEREFAMMASTFERAGLAVTRISPQDAGLAALPLRQAIVVSSRALTTAQPRAIGLRVSTNPTQSIQVLLTMRPLALPAQGRPVEPDDAVPVN